MQVTALVMDVKVPAWHWRQAVRPCIELNVPVRHGLNMVWPTVPVKEPVGLIVHAPAPFRFM